VTLQSGIPFSVYGSDTAFEAVQGDLAPGRTVQSAIKSGDVKDRLGNCFPVSDCAYFDTTAFVAPNPAGTSFGTLGRNIIPGPKQINTDLSILKSIPFTESQKLEFRAEFFNLFNNVNWANPINTLNSANVGAIVATTTGPRVIQFGLKYNF